MLFVYTERDVKCVDNNEKEIEWTEKVKSIKIHVEKFGCLYRV